MSKRVFIVTGAARGIGFACARRLIEDGYRVVLSDMDGPACKQALETIGASAERAISVECDVSDKLEVHNLIASTLASFGRVDGLINNAGIALKGGVLSVNLRGAFLVSKAVATHMVNEIENREDRSHLTDRPYVIINMSSINDTVAIPDYLAYTISKGGLLQMTKAMAIELAPFGIRVNAIGPGSVKTDMLAGVSGDKLGEIHARTPLGRVALPDEVAGVASFLASEDSSYITGQCIYVDGGRLALNYTMPPKSILSGE